MFCTKCGSRMPDDQTFCTKCGAKLENNFQVSERRYADKAVRNYPAPELKGQNSIIKGLISIVLMIVCLICTLTKTFKIDLLWASEGITIFEMTEWSALKPILIVIYICSILIFAVSFIKKYANKKVPLIIALGTVSITILLFIIVFCMALSKASDYGADIAFTFSGILLILGSIINLILLSLQLRNIRK